MKQKTIALLLLAEIMVMSPWFISAAVLPEMLAESAISPGRQALLSSMVQAGFVFGALLSAFLNLPDRVDPRWLFALCGAATALANGLLLIAPIGGDMAVFLRFMTGMLLAGVYPVGLKIIVGWGTTDRGLLTALVVGAVTIGSASPNLIAFIGGIEWRYPVAATTVLCALGSLLVLGCSLGPHHSKASGFDPSALKLAWQNKRIRYAYLGYLGHMWELYAMWAWMGAALALSYGQTLTQTDAQSLAKLTAFISIAGGSIACIYAGYAADKIGKAKVTIIAMGLSGSSAIACAITLGGPVWLSFLLFTLWGLCVIPDSAQFSAIVADASPPAQSGTLMTFQTALGFALTTLTVQITPVLVGLLGWPTVLALMALGPFFGVVCMWRLLRLGDD